MPLVRRQRLLRDVENRTNAIAHDRFIELGRIDLNLLIPAICNHADGQLSHLPNLFLKRHPLEQGLDLL